jgi:hypothetical protein
MHSAAIRCPHWTLAHSTFLPSGTLECTHVTTMNLFLMVGWAVTMVKRVSRVEREEGGIVGYAVW